MHTILVEAPTDGTAAEFAEKILAEFGIDKGTMVGISETGVHLQLTRDGSGLIFLELIGQISEDQYKRLFEGRHNGCLPE